MANPNGRVTHGLSKTKAHRVWANLRNRCNNPNNKRYAQYGGRGITVDPRWDDFTVFYADMGEVPEGMSIERIDNDGPYSPENCRWAPKAEQMRNTSRTVTYEGKSLAEWAKELGVPPTTVGYRVRKWGSPHYPVEARNKLEIDGRPLAEVARELGIPYQTARMHYYMHGHLDRLKR